MALTSLAPVQSSQHSLSGPPWSASDGLSYHPSLLNGSSSQISVFSPQHLCTRVSYCLGCTANSLANSALFSETQIRHLLLWEGLLVLTPPPSTVGAPPQAPLGAWACLALSAFSCLGPADPQGRDCAWLISALLVPKCGSPFTRQGGHRSYLYDLSKVERGFRPCC